MKKLLLKPKTTIIVLLAILTFLLMVNFIYQKPQEPSRATAGIPRLFFTIDPSSLMAGDSFDFIVNVNPNNASFNAFELYFYYDSNLVEFADMNNLSANISSAYPLIKSTIDTSNTMITIIGTRTGLPFSGAYDLEIARVKMKVRAEAMGIMNFPWDSNTKIGSKISRDLVDGAFPIITPTITPTEIPPQPTDAGITFRVWLPDVIADPISPTDVEVELRDGASILQVVNTDLVRDGLYYKTGSPVFFSIPENKTYGIFVKSSISLGRFFSNVNLVESQTLDCITGIDPDCGDLLSPSESKALLSGDSDGFNKGSGSYNKIDSADLQVLATYFNEAGNGAAAAADFNLDGQVSISDLEIIGKNYSSFGD